MDRDPDERPGADGDVDAFDAIVAGWRNEGSAPEWPQTPPRGTDRLWFGDPATDDGRPDGETEPSEGAADASPSAPDAPGDSHGGRTAVPGPDTEDEHFVPPEPPPLPRLGPPAAVGLVLLVLGLVLVSAPQWLGVPSLYGLPLGLLSLAAGLGWLVLRLWPTPPGPDDDDDGAVL